MRDIGYRGYRSADPVLRVIFCLAVGIGAVFIAGLLTGSAQTAHSLQMSTSVPSSPQPDAQRMSSSAMSSSARTVCVGFRFVDNVAIRC